jgi:hypothetical protein
MLRKDFDSANGEEVELRYHVTLPKDDMLEQSKT